MYRSANYFHHFPRCSRGGGSAHPRNKVVRAVSLINVPDAGLIVRGGFFNFLLAVCNCTVQWGCVCCSDDVIVVPLGDS